MKKKGLVATLVLGSSIFFIAEIINACNSPSEQPPATGWSVPSSAERLNSPFAFDLVSEEKGRTLYKQYCRACHGENGLGDGAAGKDLPARPSNFHHRSSHKVMVHFSGN